MTARSVRPGDRFDGGVVEALEVGRWSTYAFVRSRAGFVGRWTVVSRHPKQLTLDIDDGDGTEEGGCGDE